MELSFDGYFEILFDQDPQYEDDIEEVYDGLDRLIDMRPFLKYKQFTDPDKYKAILLTKGRKIIHQFKIDLTNNKINDLYLESFLDELRTEIDNYIMISINNNNYLCHKEAYITSDVINPLSNEDRVDLNKMRDWMADYFIAYNKYRYEVLQYMANEIESILSKTDSNHDDSWKLELNKSTMSDIALLFRLLDENKVYTAKHKTHIFRVIQNSFKGSDKSTFNEGSIKNAYNEPDPNSVENLKFLLANMKTSLKNI